MIKDKLNLRMYFFVPYNLSPIQQAIQAGHAALEYAHKFGDTDLFKDFIENHKTWIILNGGTTNERLDNQGDMQDLEAEIIVFNDPFYERADLIDFSTFREPDLNDTLTAICFIVDERVFNCVDYPNWRSFIWDKLGSAFASYINKSDEELEKAYPKYYNEWLELIGGPKNKFFKYLLGDKKLA